MSFHSPYFLVVPPVVLAALLALFFGSHRARQRLLGQFAAARLLPSLLASSSPALRRFKYGLLAAGAVLVAFALARPQWGYEWQETHTHGVDIIFALDTSKSMLAEDVKPNRLERAKLAIFDLIQKIPGDRVGLVAFAGQAFLQCPLTLDDDAFRETLDAMDTKVITRGGTDIAAGLDECEEALEKSGNHKIIVLFTDGEDLEGQGVAEARDLAARGVTIYTVGVGTTEGDIIPIRDAQGRQDFVRDDQGQIVKTKMDPATLTSIAEATGGFFVPLGATGEGLNQVYENGIKTIPQQDLASTEQRALIERFQWPLALGLLLLAVETLIGTRKPAWSYRRVTTAMLADLPSLVSSPIKPKEKMAQPAAAAVHTTMVIGLAALLLALPHRLAAQISVAPPAAPASSEPSPAATAPATTATTSTGAASPSVAGVAAAQGQYLFQNGDYKGAAQAYQQAAEASPQDGRFRYNQGASLYRSGDFDAAAQAFEQTLTSPDLALQQQAYYNLGNSQYREGQAQLKDDPKKTVPIWEDAIKDYKNAVELAPNDADARYNLDLAQKQLDELKKMLEEQQKQQQKNQQGQQNQQQNQQDQQNQPQNQQQNQSSQQNQQDQQNQQNQQNNSGQQNQPPQNQSSQQNQSGQQNQQNQNQQNQSGGQNQQSQNQSGNQNQQNQNGGQGQQQQNQSGNQNQNQQNQSGNQSPQNQNGNPNQQNQNGGQNPQQQNHSGNQNPNQQGQSGNQNQQNQNGSKNQQNQNGGQDQQQQNQNGSQNPQNQNGGQSQQNQNGNRGPQPQNQSGNQNQQNQPGGQNQNQAGQPGNQNQPKPSNSGTQANGANQNQNQAQANSAASPASQGKEPATPKSGQQQGAAGNSAQATTSGNATTADGSVAVQGMMTREEARQMLDSLKTIERKLPAASFDPNKQGGQPSPNQPYKDW